MKAILVFFLLAASAFAQDRIAGAAVAPGCGQDDVKFNVKTVNAQQPPTQPDAGKALVYFIEDDSDFESFPKPTTRAGLDGGWVGATHGNSYFTFSVDPGIHHLCAGWQSTVIVGAGHQKVAAHFRFEAGNVYFLKVKNTYPPTHGTDMIHFVPVDSDEGMLLVSKIRLSTSQPKK
ncbi:MAG: hypothetical protein ABSG25_13575 [Bryobacteraceae bacterium]